MSDGKIGDARKEGRGERINGETRTSRISTATFEIRVSIQSEIEEEGANFILFDPKHATRVNPVMSEREETLWRVWERRAKLPPAAKCDLKRIALLPEEDTHTFPAPRCCARLPPVLWVARRPTLKKAAHRLPAPFVLQELSAWWWYMCGAGVGSTPPLPPSPVQL